MGDSDIKTEVKSAFTAYLNAHAMRRTAERYAILDTIYSIKGHFDVEELYDLMLNEEKFRVSVATLYNTLTILIDAQLVQRHQFGSSPQYECTCGVKPHGHAVCTICGKVTEFQNPEILSAVSGKKVQNFTTSRYSVYLFGTCARCMRALKRREKRKAGNGGKQQSGK
jgi:Fur family ferric uptake transcriptional regulator